MLPCVDVPSTLKTIQPYMKTAAEHEQRDPVITYWCCFYGLQAALKIDRNSKEAVAFLTSTLDWLEKMKKTHKDNEAIHQEVVAQAYIENYALKLFLWADGEDRASKFNKNVVKAFYTSGMIFDILATFGELTDEVTHHRKYAKWKATYIHNCLKNGETPIAGPMANEDGDNFGDLDFSNSQPSGQPAPAARLSPTSSSHMYPPYPPEETVSPPSSFLSAPTPGSHAPPSTPSGSNHPSPSSSRTERFTSPHQLYNGVSLNAEDFHKAQKYCKFAGSALQYEDVPTAVDNLQKALLLLTTGNDQ